jgi:alpha-galactosidase
MSRAGSPEGFADLRRAPDLVRAFGAEGEIPLHRVVGDDAASDDASDGVWAGAGVVVGFGVEPDRLAVRLRARVPMVRLQLRWRADLGAVTRYLGDHWERSYGDLEWRGEAPERVMPWYLLTHDGERTHGYGVRVGPSALCFWTADRAGLSLWADLRSGGRPVRLRDRVLEVCDVVVRPGTDQEQPFAAAQALCRAMCPAPRLPDHPVYGANDWHVAYGQNSFTLISRAAERIGALAPAGDHRPYSVIDDGWSQGGLGRGPWYGNERFGQMDRVAAELIRVGVRPGLWYRPLSYLPGVADRWRMPHNGCLDPTLPQVLELIAEHLRRFVDWGYPLVKHDFTSWDVLGRWGFEMGASVTDDGWGFADDSLTTAEVLLGLYRTIREAAGDAILIGCNTVGHLAAGLVELQRIGDDTSGRSWNRTRRMGVNALAFRGAQHGTFFAVDADVAPITGSLPPDAARQWLELVAGSGTPLFVALAPDIHQRSVLAQVREALTAAAVARPVAEPLDWLDTVCPSRWRLDGGERSFDWTGVAGGWPFGD